MSQTRNTLSPDISVCIANYNGLDIIEKCIESVLNQTGKLSIEIIIHDDASSDSSVELIQTKYPEINLIISSTNVGFCISNNRMVEASSGKYILLLNNDACLHTNALIQMYNYANINNFQGILSVTQYDANGSKILDNGCALDLFMNPMPLHNMSEPNVSMVMGACLWIPSKTWYILGGFPEWFESIAEDLFLCLAAWTSGYSVRVISTSGYDHHVGKSLGGGKINNNQLSTTYRRRSLSERNKSFVLCIFTPFPVIIIHLTIHIIFLFLEGMILSLVQMKTDIWKRIYWPAITALWKYRDKLQSKRKRMQGIRGMSIYSYYKLFSFSPYKFKMLIKYGLPSIK